MDASPAKPLRASAWEWAQVALLALNLGWTTLCLGGYRPETLIFTLPLTALALCVHLLARIREPQRAHPAGWLLLPFLAYAAGNVLWVTPERWLGWRDWLGWVQMIAVFWIVLNGVRSRAARATLFGVLLLLGLAAVVLACYQRFVRPDWLMLGRTQADQFIGRASGCFGIPNSLAALLLLILPATSALALQRGARAEQRVLFGFLTFGFALGLVLTVSRGAWLAFAAVLVLWPLWGGRGALVRRMGWSFAAFAAVAAVGITLYLTMPLVRDRLTQLRTYSGERTRPIMWRGAWKLFLAHPAWGSGAGSYNDLFEKYRPEDYQDVPNWAHNDYLNTLSDYGATGFGLFFGAAALIAWRSARATRVSGLAAAGPPPLTPPPGVRSLPETDDLLPAGALVVGLAAFALQLFVDFHFKIPALAMAFAVVAALVVRRAWPAGVVAIPRRGSWLGSIAGVGLIVVAIACWILPIYRAEALRYGARQSIDHAARAHVATAEMGRIVLAARDDLARAVAIDPANADAWADLSYAIALRAHNESKRVRELGREAGGAADRALALASVSPEFWARRGAALDLQGRWYEAGNAYIQALRLSPARGTFWYYHAYHLSLDLTDPGRAEAAIAFCLRLDPGNSEAQALQRQLAERRHAP